MTRAQAVAAAYLTRTGNADLLPVLGLAPSPPPRRVRLTVVNRGWSRCLCATRGLAYRLCPDHGSIRKG